MVTTVVVQTSVNSVICRTRDREGAICGVKIWRYARGGVSIVGLSPSKYIQNYGTPVLAVDQSWCGQYKSMA